MRPGSMNKKLEVENVLPKFSWYDAIIAYWHTTCSPPTNNKFLFLENHNKKNVQNDLS